MLHKDQLNNFPRNGDSDYPRLIIGQNRTHTAYYVGDRYQKIAVEATGPIKNVYGEHPEDLEKEFVILNDIMY